MISPRIQLLDTQTIERVVDEACQVLADPGVRIDSTRALRILGDAGAEVDLNQKVARLPRGLIDNALHSAPVSIPLYDLAGQPRCTLGGDSIHFHPGSTGLLLLDPENGAWRPPTTPDFVRFIKVVEGLPNLDLQSTALLCHDVPKEVQDSYRNYLLLRYATKPIMTGAYSAEGQLVEIELFEAMAGGREKLRAKPPVIMTICPSPPLHWSDWTADNVIACAEAGLPVSYVSMPLAGATGPATLIGSVVQLAAEVLSGIVLSQTVRPGTGSVWAGSPAIFDMREGTTPMGAIETLMIDCASVEVGKHLGLPTHFYMSVSDSKTVDAQAGIDSTAGLLLAALAGVNLIFGAGMLNLESAQSVEDLIIDHDVIGMARRLVRGIDTSEESLGLAIIRDVGFGGNFLGHTHTRRWFSKEQFMPQVMSREALSTWQERGRKDVYQRARERANQLEQAYQPHELPVGLREALDEIMLRAAGKYGMERLPES
jgi:trimethylamine---corrinoid protein Co-methyltransferase